MSATETITLASGCFWCSEAVFGAVKGVTAVVSGYTGGAVANPTYRAVCTGQTGHAEAVQVAYDTAAVSTREILEVFFATHDPTTLNRQGADVGTQYRSAIFYHTDAQKSAAEQLIGELTAAGVFPGSIVTEVAPFTTFYAAEAEHQEYYRRNRLQPYCMIVINPKLAKFRKQFAGKARS
ncbi:MAG: peptide-methionine (S)-S-oxide reductase MsrA [Chloroflexi bacterium]|nr:peptide-methionine (S)-S-oxide reductase MsrA [Chloroflexota bacterium]